MLGLYNTFDIFHSNLFVELLSRCSVVCGTWWHIG